MLLMSIWLLLINQYASISLFTVDMSVEKVVGRCGKIKSVHCQKFVTYDDCVFYPCEYLNVIIGPNGTGKSTLVAAIVLGLGGEPKLLARASFISDYIKNGYDTATVAVEVYNDGERMTRFERSFNQSGKSKFRVDDRVISHKAFLEEVNGFRIQVSNLCQFLPQDKVQDFASMTPQEIFVNTLNSVCEPDVIRDFKILRELQCTQKVVQTTKTTLEDKIALATHRITELKSHLEQYYLQKNIEDQLNVCKAKKLRLEMQNILYQIDECDNDLRLAKRNLANCEKEFEKFEGKLSDVDHFKSKIDIECQQTDQNLKAADTQISFISNNIDTLKKILHSQIAELQNKERAACEKRNDLINENRLLQLYKQDMENLLPKDPSQPSLEVRLSECVRRLEEIRREIYELDRRHSEIQNSIDEYYAELQSLKQRKDELKNVNRRKIECLKSAYPDVYKAIVWLNGNNDLFQGRIYRPVILELNVLSPNHSKFLENVINLRDLLAFSCESANDLSILVTELCVNQKLLVNVFHAPQSDAVYRPKIPIEDLRVFGFDSYLVNLVAGPPAIMGYLCKIYNLHNIPYGNSHVNENTDFIPQDIKTFFGGNMRYGRSVSKYGIKASSIMKTIINSKMLLTCCDQIKITELDRSLEHITRQTDKLKNNRSALEVQIREMGNYFKREVVVKKQICNQQTEWESKVKQVQKQKDKIESVKSDILGFPRAKEVLSGFALNALKDMLRLQRQKMDSLLDLKRFIKKKSYLKTKSSIFAQENEKLISHIEVLRNKRGDQKKLVFHIGNTCENLKRDAKNMLKESLRLTSQMDPMEDEFPHKSLYSQLPNNIEEIKDKIVDLSARLDCVNDINPEIVREYEIKRLEVQTLKNESKEIERSLINTHTEIQMIYNRWYPKVNDVISIISRHFSKFMESLCYVGEVKIIHKEEHDFESYGIEILVQYRNNIPLQILNRHVQSGGERAVAIAIYTLSMQHLIRVPFRCVDEINQGMDALNEKRIFEMLVDQTTKVGMAQYFFVTPKLLHNMKSNDRMRVHVVFNGRMIQSPNVFNCT